MTDDNSEYSGHPGDLSERETLERLTVEEKKTIAHDAIAEFPHLGHDMLDDWARSFDCEIPANDSQLQKVDKLVDCLEKSVRSGNDLEALDRFIYGYMYPANLKNHGIDPDEVAGRDPIEGWGSTYQNGDR